MEKSIKEQIAARPLAPRAVEILRYLARQRDHNAKTSRFYYKDWRHLARLRHLELIEPSDASSGSVVTQAGRDHLASLKEKGNEQS